MIDLHVYSVLFPSLRRRSNSILLGLAGPGNMHSAVQRALLRWHGFLRLPRHPQSWYKDRLREEICERRLATTPFQKLNETADVFYIISRVQYDSHALRRLPDFILPHLVVYAYLLSKYTSRWQFYRVAASCVFNTRSRQPEQRS